VVKHTRLGFLRMKSSYCFQCVLAITILSVHPLSVRHTGGSVKNGAS